MKKTILLSFLFLSNVLAAFAQNETETAQYDDPNKRLITIKQKFTDNFYLDVQGGSYFSWGTNLKFTPFFERFNPAAGIAVGKWVTPYFSPRLDFAWGMNKGQLLAPKRNYKFHSLALTGNAVFSLSNLFFRYNPQRKLNVLLISGVGMEYTFGFSKEKWNASKFYYNPDSKLHLSLHAGLGAKYRVSNSVDLGLESIVTFSGNTFDGGYRGKGSDGHVNIMATVGYRFLNSTGSHLMTFKSRRFMTSYHHKRPKVRKISTEYIAIVATDDKNRIQSTAYFTPDSMSVDNQASLIVQQAVEQFRAHDSNVKVYLTVKDKIPEDLPLFLLRAKSIKEMMMNDFIVPAGSIFIERNPEVVKTLDPEKVAVVVYIDDKPGYGQVTVPVTNEKLQKQQVVKPQKEKKQKKEKQKN